MHTPQKSLVLFSKNLKGAYFWLDIFCNEYECKGKTEFDFSLVMLATKVNLEMQNYCLENTVLLGSVGVKISADSYLSIY